MTNTDKILLQCSNYFLSNFFYTFNIPDRWTKSDVYEVLLFIAAEQYYIDHEQSMYLWVTGRKRLRILAMGKYGSNEHPLGGTRQTYWNERGFIERSELIRYIRDKLIAKVEQNENQTVSRSNLHTS